MSDQNQTVFQRITELGECAEMLERLARAEQHSQFAALALDARKRVLVLLQDVLGTVVKDFKAP